MIHIITPCTRPHNLLKMKESIPAECNWIIVYDNTVKNPIDIDGAVTIRSPYTGHFGNPNRNVGLDYLRDNGAKDEDWVCILDDDNILHPDWYETIKEEIQQIKAPIVIWNQVYPNGNLRALGIQVPAIAKIDTAQYMVRWAEAKNIRYKEIYEADGIYAEEVYATKNISKLVSKNICYYNYLRANKVGNSLLAKIAMISMFKNEADNIRQMLDSVAPYIDFWVLQDNGSTDGTPEIVKQWAKETNIPGFMYQVEEGWVNFGWNRDHLLQTCLKTDHGCDWIMKMDCDETLVVEPGFDWSHFWRDKTIQSFHVQAENPGIVYYRAWIWNAKLPWKFNHDPAHETITLELDNIGENFQRVNLPAEFKMTGGVKLGESYSVPTKYVTDALKLEEKLIREGTMLSDLYHFWYIGKSYEDCYRGNFFPLGELHQKQYAERCIFYYTELVNHTHNFTERGGASHIDEMGYYAVCAIGNAYRFLKEYDKAIVHYEQAESFCPRRNDHVMYLAEVYWELRDFKKMLYYTNILMQPERTCPFPDFYFLINTNMYYDKGTYPMYLHSIALENVEQENNASIFRLNRKPKKRVFVVDNFYEDPHYVRNFALQQNFIEQNEWYKGKRSENRYITPQIKRSFEDILGFKIREWESHGMNGKLQYCTPQDALVYHYDSQSWAGLVYLTPEAPFESGTSLWAHRKTKIRHVDEPGSDECFVGGFYDKSKFEMVDMIGNVFNRLVLFDARSFHAANEYFGTNKYDSRLFHLFFFD